MQLLTPPFPTLACTLRSSTRMGCFRSSERLRRSWTRPLPTPPLLHQRLRLPQRLRSPRSARGLSWARLVLEHLRVSKLGDGVSIQLFFQRCPPYYTTSSLSPWVCLGIPVRPPPSWDLRLEIPPRHLLSCASDGLNAFNIILYPGSLWLECLQCSFTPKAPYYGLNAFNVL